VTVTERQGKGGRRGREGGGEGKKGEGQRESGKDEVTVGGKGHLD
jgi:hypothetical protein